MPHCPFPIAHCLAPQRLLTCALLGLLTTVIVAWIAALLHQRPGTRLTNFGSIVEYFPDRDNSRLWYFTRTRASCGTALVIVSSHHDVPKTGPIPDIEPTRALKRAELPGWSVMAERPGIALTPTLSSPPVRFVDEGYGWPWPALAQRFMPSWRSGLPALTLNGGLRLSPMLRFLGKDSTLPLRPIVGGLLANAAVAAALWMAALMIFAALRGRWRHQHGHCARCGYDLTGAAHGACPECGAAVITETNAA